MNYIVGDIQGCCAPLQQLLQKIDFSPSRDHLYVLGDMINRGPTSRDTLRLLMGLGNSASCLLGNHDLHFLGVVSGCRQLQLDDTLQELLEAPDRDEVVEWLRHRPMAIHEAGWLMVHAGVPPQWDLAMTLAQARLIESRLQAVDWQSTMPLFFGGKLTKWDADWDEDQRLSFAVNALTRTRYCTPDGELSFKEKYSPSSLATPPMATPKIPWFDVVGRRTQDVPIAFGHWSALGLYQKPDLLGLDSGCVWGNCLSAARLEPTGVSIIQIACPTAQQHG